MKPAFTIGRFHTSRLALALVLVGTLVGIMACGSAANGTPAGADSDSSASGSSPNAGRADSSNSSGTPPTSEPPSSTTEPTVPAPLGAPYPIVLMHGMAGFGELEVGPIGITYFEGVAEDLTKRGEAVYVTLVPPYDTTEVRAQALSVQIDQILARTGKAKVNLVAHSQGGLDARVIASPAGLGYGSKIATITTIATPHRGSRVADAALGLLGVLPARVVDDVTGVLLGVLQKTAYELQTDAHLRGQVKSISESYMNDVFNPKYVDAPGVRYMSYAGRTNLRTGIGVCDGGKYANQPLDLDPTQVALIPTAAFLEEGLFLKVNDGLVTVESAKWGEFQQCVPADHLKEVGLLGPTAATFDHLAFFRAVVERVRATGN